MTNPYAAPNSSGSDPTGSASSAKGKAWLATGLFCSLLVSALLTLVGWVAFPQFSEAYQNFGAEMPLLTRVFIRFYLLVWAIPLAVVLAWNYWPDRGRRHMIAGTIGIVAMVILIPIAIIALYLPIFGMAAAI